MTSQSNIGWTQWVWNPVTGCSHVSEGCRHCYAEALSGRYGWTAKPWTWANAPENVVLHPERIGDVLRPSVGLYVFTNSMSDLNHELVPIDFLDQCYAAMAVAYVLHPRKLFQKLTKRSDRMREYLDDPDVSARVQCLALALAAGAGLERGVIDEVRRGWTWPLANVWEGISVEDRWCWGHRRGDLAAARCAHRWVSFEPLLESLAGELMPSWVEWAVIGGESGPAHRAMDPRWAQDLARTLRANGARVFFKQQSGRYPGRGQGQLGDEVYEDLPPLLTARR